MRRRRLLAAPALLALGPSRDGAAVTLASHLTPDSTLGELLRHPAFAGFAPLLLPWDERPYDEAASLRGVARLMPYHSAVRPDEVVAALNRMIDDAAAGRTVFHRFYDQAEIRRDPSKANTGLVQFRGQPGAPFAIVCPGGGFVYVGSLHEGFPIADAIAQAGLNAFVLRYRAGMGGAAATTDLSAALEFVRRNAAALRVGAEGYALWGASAGARMAAAVGSAGPPGLAAVITAYTAYPDVGPADPPTFAIVGAQDSIASPASMERRQSALRREGVPTELRVIAGIGHGFGLGTGTPAEGWVAEAIRFWQRYSRAAYL